MKHKLSSLLLAIGISLTVFFIHDEKLMLWMLLAILVVFHVFLFIGIFNIKFNYFIKSIHRVDSSHVYLTFDDGPDPEFTPKILDLLKKHKIPASFFIIGSKAEQHPEIVKRIAQEGHTIGNHSYHHHNNIAFLSTRKLIEEIKKCSDTLQQILGKRISLFRPPVGITNPNYRRMLKTLHLKSIGWSVRTLDTKEKNKTILLEKLKNNLQKGNIILLHDTQKITESMMDEFLDYAVKNGTTFANLPE